MLPSRRIPARGAILNGQLKKRILSDQDLRAFDIVTSAPMPRSAHPEIIVLSSSDEQEQTENRPLRNLCAKPGLKFCQVPTDDEAFVPLPSLAQPVDSPRGTPRRRRRRKPRARSESIEALLLTSAPPRRFIPPALNAMAFGDESPSMRERMRRLLIEGAQKTELVEASGAAFVDYAKQQWLGPLKLMDAPPPNSLEEYMGL